MKKTFLIFQIFLSLFSSAQINCRWGLSGKIADVHTGEPLDSVQITITNLDGNLKYETYSNGNGEYSIKPLCEGNYKIIVYHPDCSPKIFKLSVDKNTKRNFSLEHHEKELQEVLTVGRTQGRTKTSAESRLSGKQIAEYSETNIGTALSSISGVSAFSTGANIVKPVIHGLHSSRVPILNNGIRQEDQQWGVEHAPDIDLNAAQSLTVIKGAGALEYAGDAVGGIVLVEPKSLTKKDTLLGSVLTSYISNGRGGNVSANVEKGFGNGLSFSLQGTYKRLGDFSAPDYNLSNTGMKENDFSAQVEYQKKRLGIKGFYSYFGTNIGILKASSIGNLENLVEAINNRTPLIINPFSKEINAPRQTVTHQLAKLNAYTLFDVGKMSFTYGFQRNHREEYDLRRSEYADKPAVDLELTTHSFNFDFEHFEIHKFRGKAGLMYTYQKNFPIAGTGVSPLIPYYQKYNYGAYWTETYKASDRLTFEGGLRYDFQNIEALKLYTKSRWKSLGYDSLYSDLIVQDFGLSYLVNPMLNYNGFATVLGVNYQLGKSTDLTFNYSFSSRAPNAGELFSDGLHESAAAVEIGDLALKNEKSNKLIANLKTHLFNYRLKFELTLHYNYIHDFINEIPSGAEYSIRGAFPVWKYMQTNAEIFGADVDGSYQFSPHWNLITRFSIIYGQDTQYTLPLMNMPPTQWVNSLEYRNNDWEGFFSRLTSTSVFRKQRFPDYNFPVQVVRNGELVSEMLDISTPPSGFQLFDFESGFSLHITKKNHLDFSFSIKNIFNVSYREYLNRLRYYADEAGRNFVLKAQYNF
ncbi:MAG: TonB-dependent receptor [Flavobacteriaceae bacterium]|jgi:iron complex outermembrane receptor protein|nr:TonB-dependent receptor [Flavobacteriaceae bacterium]